MTDDLIAEIPQQKAEAAAALLPHTDFEGGGERGAAVWVPSSPAARTKIFRHLGGPTAAIAAPAQPPPAFVVALKIALRHATRKGNAPGWSAMSRGAAAGKETTK